MASETTVAMDEMFDQLRKIIHALATVAGELQRQRSDQRDSINAEFRDLQGIVDSTARRVTSIVEGAKSEIRQSAEQSLDKSLGPAVDRVVQKCQAAENSVQQSTNRLAQAQQSLESAVGGRMRTASYALFAGALLLIGGAGYLLYSASAVKSEAEQMRTEIAYLDRLRNADLVPCGDASICARIDEKAARIGDGKQYKAVATRK